MIVMLEICKVSTIIEKSLADAVEINLVWVDCVRVCVKSKFSVFTTHFSAVKHSVSKYGFSESIRSPS